jgi:hypothetical protein
MRGRFPTHPTPLNRASVGCVPTGYLADDEYIAAHPHEPITVEDVPVLLAAIFGVDEQGSG